MPLVHCAPYVHAAPSTRFPWYGPQPASGFGLSQSVQLADVIDAAHAVVVAAVAPASGATNPTTHTTPTHTPTPTTGIVATNGTHRREGLHTSHMALDKIGSGRLSGAPLTQRAVEVVRRIHTRSGGNFPIIGVGGIMSPADAKAMLDAGADLLQLYTGYIYEGPGLVGEICRSLIADAEAAAAAKAAAEARAEEEARAAAQAAEAKAAAATASGANPRSLPSQSARPVCPSG